MKNLKLNKKILFASLGSIIGLSAVAAVAAACTNGDNAGNENVSNGSGESFNANSETNQLDFYWKAPKGDTSADLESILKSMGEDGKKAFILPGFNQSEKLQPILSTNKLDPNFSGYVLDAFYNENKDEKYIPNADRVAAVYFKVDEAAFLAGIAAAYMLNANQKLFKASEDGLKWGGYVGANAQNTTNFMAGMSLGVRWANEKLANKSIKQEGSEENLVWVEVQEVHASESAAGGFGSDNKKAKQIIDELVSNKADLILPVAAPQVHYAISGTITASRPVGVIGVDTAQEKDLVLNKNTQNFKDSNFENKDGVIRFSITKNLDVATTLLLNKAIENKPFVGGTKVTTTTSTGVNNVANAESSTEVKQKLFGKELHKEDAYKLGTNTVGGIADGIVGISQPGQKYLIEAFNLAQENESDKLNTYDAVKNKLAEDELFLTLNEEPKEAGKFKFAEGSTTSGTLTTGQSIDAKVNGGTVYLAANNEVYVYPVLKSTYIAESSSDVFKKAWESAQNDESKKRLVGQVLSFAGLNVKDSGFSETTFNGVINFYKEKGISIPKVSNNK